MKTTKSTNRCGCGSFHMQVVREEKLPCHHYVIARCLRCKKVRAAEEKYEVEAPCEKCKPTPITDTNESGFDMFGGPGSNGASP